MLSEGQVTADSEQPAGRLVGGWAVSEVGTAGWATGGSHTQHGGWPGVSLLLSAMNFLLFVLIEPITKLNDGYVQVKTKKYKMLFRKIA